LKSKLLILSFNISIISLSNSTNVKFLGFSHKIYQVKAQNQGHISKILSEFIFVIKEIFLRSSSLIKKFCHKDFFAKILYLLIMFFILNLLIHILISIQEKYFLQLFLA
jgi:hypothetical protein